MLSHPSATDLPRAGGFSRLLDSRLQHFDFDARTLKDVADWVDTYSLGNRNLTVFII